VGSPERHQELEGEEGKKGTDSTCIIYTRSDRKGYG